MKNVDFEQHKVIVDEIYDFIMNVIEMIWEPEKQIENVYVFAPKFHERSS